MKDDHVVHEKVVGGSSMIGLDIENKVYGEGKQYFGGNLNIAKLLDLWNFIFGPTK